MAGSISTLGIGSGLELQSILDQLREVDEQTVTTKENEITELEAQLEEFTVVKNKLLDMKSAALDLSLSSTFIARTVASSDENVMTATVVEGASVGSSSIAVGRLAGKSTWLSEGVATADTSVNDQAGDEGFVYTINGETGTVTVPVGATLTELAALINDDVDNPGVTASVIDDGTDATPFKLVLQADETGKDNEIAVTSQLTDLNLTQQTPLGDNLNAEITMNGIVYQRQTNTVNDILTGVTMNLKGAGASALTVSSNDDAVKDLIVEFVAAYNEAVQEISSQASYNDATEEFGLLADTTLRDLPYALQNLMTAGEVNADADKTVTSMFSLGMEFNSDGTITIDETVLSAAIADHAAEVQEFFIGDEANDVEGFADRANTYLRGLTVGTGQVEAEKSAAQLRIDDLELQIETETARLDKRYEILTKQFIELDQYMSQMTSISDYLTSQFDSLSSMLYSNSK